MICGRSIEAAQAFYNGDSFCDDGENVKGMHFPTKQDRMDDLFIKSQVSLAETNEDSYSASPFIDDSYSASPFIDDSSDNQSLEITSYSYLWHNNQIQPCQDFLIKGCCMKGGQCKYAHLQNRKVYVGRGDKMSIWISEFPQWILGSCKRINSFLL